jgi:hypothetical protein
MRSNMFANQLYAGALVQPLFANGFTEDVWPAKDLSSVMYGPAIKVDLQFK